MQRLKTRAQFQAVMAGTTVSRTAHFALHCLALDAPQAFVTTALKAERPVTTGRLNAAPTARGAEGPNALFAVCDIWIGALVPKRWAKRAVTRNAIKRQIYSVSQAIDPPLPEAAHVVRLRSGFDRQQFVSATSDALKRAVRGELQELFAQAGSRVKPGMSEKRSAP